MVEIELTERFACSLMIDTKRNKAPNIGKMMESALYKGGEKAKEQGPVYGVPYMTKTITKYEENKQTQTNIA